jgi:hypothetical protein
MERLLQVLIQLTARTNNQRTVSKELIQVFGFTEIKLSKGARFSRLLYLLEIRALVVCDCIAFVSP